MIKVELKNKITILFFDNWYSTLILEFKIIIQKFIFVIVLNYLLIRNWATMKMEKPEVD